MAGYVIANYDVIDPAGYARYLEAVGATTAAHGGDLLAADMACEAVEGAPRKVVIVLRFESVTAAWAWYRSDDYRAIVHLRRDNSEEFLTIAGQFSATGS